MPKIYDPKTDVEIPRNAWSSWREHGKARELRRELTGEERSALTRRRDDLLPALAPFDGPKETDAVMLAIAEMFGSYRSMRQTGEDAMGLIDSTARALAAFPCWAIVKCCREIQSFGVWRGDRYERQWPPSDSEISIAVQKEIDYYERALRSTEQLLTARVEEMP